MPRSAATYRRMWSGRRKPASSSSYSDDSEDRAPRDYDFFGSSDLSEPETEPEYTPETEDGTFDKSGPRDYRFELRETVWVKPRGCFEWFRGTVLKIREPPLRDRDSVKRGTLYLVIFRRHHTNMRDIFSSTEGNIRPDTPPVRALVRGAS
ncbi:hypothetical protein GSI_06925 [Ganoderma sinense ZZ0214-1]|uniref:Uncharacterized protein n=1 Tax=Ganoderma sinense ZZ0214-1 TaxID=1077348 RepID=A0A2G8SAH4_9APHY|nr:hypothetical protein GSI_06925 [Ganoderma sinense ZZ0214-1]